MIKVKIISITPEDKFNLVGRKGNLHKDSLGTKRHAVIDFANTERLTTSKIQEVIETNSMMEIKTKNSVYKLKLLGGNIND